MNDLQIRALNYLNTEPLLHVDMSEVILRGTADVLSAGPHGVLLYERESGACMISAKSVGCVEMLLDAAPSCALFTVHQQFLIEPVKKRFGLDKSWACVQTVYTRKDKLSVRSRFDIRPLDPSHSGMVAEHYHLLDADGIGRIISKGLLIGGFANDRLAGFAGNHEEGSMGMLFVLPEFRRQGLAIALESFLINRLLDMGRVPFGQIFEDNAASLKLQQSLGMSLTPGRVWWVY